MMPMNRTVRDHCERVRNSRRCAMRTGCNDRVMPSDGCCPICGKTFGALTMKNILLMWLKNLFMHV